MAEGSKPADEFAVLAGENQSFGVATVFDDARVAAPRVSGVVSVLRAQLACDSSRERRRRGGSADPTALTVDDLGVLGIS